MVLLLKDLKPLEIKKDPPKVSLAYLKGLCEKYYLITDSIPKENKRAWSGAYKGILEKIGHDYSKFEQFIEYYILINRALRIAGKKTGNMQTFNIFNLKDNLPYFIAALRIINSTKNHINYIELKFRIEEDSDGRYKL